MIREKEIQHAIYKFSQQLDSPFQLKGVFFDMDGVLFDSMPLHAQSWLKILSEEGIDIKEQDIYLNEGSTALFTIKKIFREYKNKSISNEDIEKIKDRKYQYMSTLRQAEVMHSIPELLNTISEQNIDCWVVTGSAQKILLNRLKKEFNGILKRDKIITANDVKNGKPNPEPYLIGMSKSKYNIKEAIVIENAPLGVQSAKAAGLFTIAINTGPIEPKLLKDSGADLVLSGSDELMEIWPYFYQTICNLPLNIQKSTIEL